jgi:hypothetical protein
MCNFSIDFTGSATHVITRAKQAIENARGTFNGNENSGNFTINTPVGNIQGAYTIMGSTMQVSVTDKPFFLSCDKIKEELKKRLM